MANSEVANSRKRYRRILHRNLEWRSVDKKDRADLSDPERARRWMYTFVGGGKTESTAPGGVIQDGWEKVEVWP